MRPAAIARAGLVLALALAGCATGTTSPSDLCTVEASLDPSAGYVGDTITATGGPFSADADTVVRVGGIPATNVSVDRSDDCSLCDTCLAEADCTGCETSCPDCNALCETCVETVSFDVPALEPGTTTVVIQNLYGATEPMPFTVLSDDTDTGYTGSRRRSRERGFRYPFTF